MKKKKRRKKNTIPGCSPSRNYSKLKNKISLLLMCIASMFRKGFKTWRFLLSFYLRKKKRFLAWRGKRIHRNCCKNGYFPAACLKIFTKLRLHFDIFNVQNRTFNCLPHRHCRLNDFRTPKSKWNFSKKKKSLNIRI